MPPLPQQTVFPCGRNHAATAASQTADRSRSPLPETPPGPSQSPTPPPQSKAESCSAARSAFDSSAAGSVRSRSPAWLKDTGRESPSHSTTAAPKAACSQTGSRPGCSPRSCPDRYTPRSPRRLAQSTAATRRVSTPVEPRGCPSIPHHVLLIPFPTLAASLTPNLALPAY